MKDLICSIQHVLSWKVGIRVVFSSAVFLWVFLPVVFLLNYFIQKKYSNILLLAASLIFYAWGEPHLVLLMMASVVLNWLVGRGIAQCSGNGKKAVLTLGVVCDLAILGYYKYAGFFVSMLNKVCGSEVLPVPQIALPIGISFFTFQAISYIVDVYRGDTDASPKLVNVALYISFFPQLIAGPIVKYKDINQQIEDRSITWDGVTMGFRRFVIGLAKKVLISNVMGACVDAIFSHDVSMVGGGAAWAAALTYTFQIYYDFSGYSDMAIGLGKMFGFDIMENFQYPYLSSSITEFWRRWHISLGSWFREYVYIPLGGNRKGTVRTYMNLCIVFFLTGLWHGADMSFVLWGLYHGFFAILERLGLKKWLDRHKAIGVVYCMLVVIFGWMLFRAPSTGVAVRYMLHMLLPWHYSDAALPWTEYMDLKTVAVGIVAFLGMGFSKWIPEKFMHKWRYSVPEAICCVLLLLLCMASIAGSNYNPFIYFQF